MKKLALHKVATLVVALAIGSVSIAGDALATGGGVDCSNGTAATSCPGNDNTNQKKSNMTAQSYKERYR